MRGRLALVFLAALVAAGVTAVGVRATAAPPIPVLAQTVSVPNPALVPPGMTVVFLPPAGDGFSDGGDGPGGLEWVLGDSFSHGDVPDGFVAVGARPAGDEYWRTGSVPDGLLPVLAWLPGDGFSDGGDLPVGHVPVLFRIRDDRGHGP